MRTDEVERLIAKRIKEAVALLENKISSLERDVRDLESRIN